ncbi:hypothetical protein HDU92_002075 [Lobulomyces angularis]|nr:hypothetical protein HDU92_002075 [Lobulomyces angularis]
MSLPSSVDFTDEAPASTLQFSENNLISKPTATTSLFGEGIASNDFTTTEDIIPTEDSSIQFQQQQQKNTTILLSILIPFLLLLLCLIIFFIYKKKRLNFSLKKKQKTLNLHNSNNSDGNGSVGIGEIIIDLDNDLRAKRAVMIKSESKDFIKNHKKFICIKDYFPRHIEKGIPCNVGDHIEKIKDLTNGWVKVYNDRTNLVGEVPLSVLEPVITKSH